jgi:flagellar FliL protein
MADAAVTDAEKAVQAAVTAPKGVPLKVVILLGAAMLLLGVGGAVAFLKFGGGQKPASGQSEPTPPPSSAAPASHGQAGSTEQAAPPAFFDLDSFIVNLADAAEPRYLKLTMKLDLERPDASNDLTARLPQVRDAILLLLSNKDSNSLRSTQGKFQLREEIVQRINTVLPRAGVRTVYFTEFVVQ